MAEGELLIVMYRDVPAEQTSKYLRPSERSASRAADNTAFSTGYRCTPLFAMHRFIGILGYWATQLP